MSLHQSKHETGLDDRFIDASSYGSKAVALDSLPIAWTPPFFAIPTEKFEEWLEAGSPTVDEDDSLLTINDIEEPISNVIENWKSTLPTQARIGGEREVGDVIVRSSAESENLEYRGEFKSITCPADPIEVRAAIFNIWSNALNSSNDNVDDLRLGVIVQAKAPRRGTGHLSNERRVSRISTNWTLEWEKETDEVQNSQERFSSIPIDPPALSDHLIAESPSEVREVLEQVAAHLKEESHRIHVEWVWDGSSVWMVQVDRKKTSGRAGPTSNWSHSYPKDFEPEFTVLTSAKESGSKWDKTNCLGVFQDCNLHCPDLFILEGSKMAENYGPDGFSKELKNDLEQLVEAPVVVRTDVKTGSNDDVEVFSPRSDTLTDTDNFMSFIMETFEEFQRHDYSPDKFCFLLHHFMVSKASALAHSTPGNPKVMIDGIWGLPDGLNYYSHDSFRVDIGAEEVDFKKVRCKEKYLDVMNDGEWVERSAGKPWDWKTSINDNTLFSISRKARKIAEHQGESVVVMFFIDLGVEDMGGESIPWFFWSPDKSEGELSTSWKKWSGSPITVRNEADLDRLRNEDFLATDDSDPYIRFVPTMENVRDREFVESIGEISNRLDIPIRLEGSDLSHVYYILERTGADLQTSYERGPTTHSKQFSKLVRDKIPLKIQSGGEKAQTYQVLSDDIIHLIKVKAVEEALEFSFSEQSDEEIEELADLFEIIRSYTEVKGTSMNDIKRVADEKRSEKGGFTEGIVLVSTLDERLSQNADDIDEERTPRPSVPAQLYPDENIIEELGPRILNEDGESGTIEAPLIPPPLRGSEKSQEYDLKDLGLTIRLDYDEHRLLFEISEEEDEGQPFGQKRIDEYFN